MNKTVRWAAGAATLVAAAGVSLLPTATASAAVPAPPGFTCPAGSDTYDVPSTITGPNQPALAGTVCTFAGTTAFRSVSKNGGWRVQVNSAFGSRTTNVMFYEPSFNNAKIQVQAQNGRVVIKK
ncbi:MAG TPA: hypothetical protein VGP36_08735 [Mycobacteriales bacterium]|nr:hypothetical protein [Mycobacteriales bacterium]